MLVVVCPIGFERHHVLLDEAARAQADILDLGRQREIHARYPVTSTGTPPRIIQPRNATICPPSTTMVAPVM